MVDHRQQLEELMAAFSDLILTHAPELDHGYLKVNINLALASAYKLGLSSAQDAMRRAFQAVQQ